ncbi:Pyridine nucleotide-disulfide oxidoreductase domain-containing protein 1 [Amphibalanus amphitrite]|uniref:Pyridine nucleotide-disulfide oxidoreductase domain-containing protein 1 n=1 Tax=Amphibalanus amphitrite TaxID=1232801 RepID=A0A6A4W367_AMPAM|nr:Pyridine nucleotide-disulfide oxidoreductase domain-containing protein 1 [Amphibalanus amphitrite]
MTTDTCTYLIVGGGIAGVSCAQQLSFEEPSEDIVLVSAGSMVLQTTAVQVTRLAHELQVQEVSGHQLTDLCPGLRLKQATATRLDAKDKVLHLSDGSSVRYGRLCICTGGRPRLPLPDHPAVIGIRDGHSVDELVRRLGPARRVLIVGNGGIASELVFTLKDVDVTWVIRDGSISATFVDPGAAEFLLPRLESRDQQPAAADATVAVPAPPSKRWRYHASDPPSSEGGQGDPSVPGSALGPDWLQRLQARGAGKGRVTVKYKTELRRLVNRPNDPNDSEQWPVYAELTSGETIGCDFIVSATGVLPNTEPFTEGTSLRLAADGGILVDDHMRTHETDVYAAGDACSPDWELAPHWFQMRLWSQARQMGLYAAKCMSADRLGVPLLQDFCFEMFAHVTRLLGHKLILLGLFNGQRLGTDYTALIRMTPGVEFIKVVLRDGKVQGALLLGDTDLEETFENLILSQMDVSHLGDDLLSPDVDIEDYFD